MVKKVSRIVLLACVLVCSINELQLSADEVDKKMITTKDAISLAVDDFQRVLGQLPMKFSLTIEQKQGDVIKVSLSPFPLREGGSLEIKIDKKIGAIVERIQGQ